MSLTIQHLSVGYPTPRGEVAALDDVTLSVRAGTVLGVVGESGSGKSTLLNAVAGGLDSSTRTQGSATFETTSLLDLSAVQRRAFRRDTLAYIGQNPHAALDPTMRVGRQLAHLLSPHERRPALSDEQAVHHFGRVGLPRPELVARQFPHQLSGGMAQRAVIALALCRSSRLVVADEPTASLDSTMRGQVLDLLVALARATGSTLVVVSHDLETVQAHCDRTVVLYGGRVVEDGPTRDVFTTPLHPYTAALLDAAPGREAPGQRLHAIPGSQAVRYGTDEACVFRDRCRFAVADCAQHRPAVRAVAGHDVACLRAHNLDLRGDVA